MINFGILYGMSPHGLAAATGMTFMAAKQFIDEYYSFKKTQGYSEFEISQKREALENVLIPYTEDENNKMIKDAGFSHCEMVFKWVNFATFIAIK